jgi:hypothetical protein
MRWEGERLREAGRETVIEGGVYHDHEVTVKHLHCCYCCRSMISFDK